MSEDLCEICNSRSATIVISGVAYCDPCSEDIAEDLELEEGGDEYGSKNSR